MVYESSKSYLTVALTGSETRAEKEVARRRRSPLTSSTAGFSDPVFNHDRAHATIVLDFSAAGNDMHYYLGEFCMGTSRRKRFLSLAEH